MTKYDKELDTSTPEFDEAIEPLEEVTTDNDGKRDETPAPDDDQIGR